ncbi:MAG: hypothetical protein KGQ41_03635 [Alphaproteobacteria bacterium]|nr:hypothetical protein [Alphaproteobacteria bacterium]
MTYLSDATFWVLLSFLIFVGVFIRVGWSQVIAMLDGRIGEIRSEIDTAEKLRREAADMLAQYQARHRDAMKEAAEIAGRAKVQAETIRAKAEADLRETMARREKQLADRLTRIEQAAEAELRQATAALALKASETVIRKGLDAKGQAALVDQSVAALKAI